MGPETRRSDGPSDECRSLEQEIDALGLAPEAAESLLEMARESQIRLGLVRVDYATPGRLPGVGVPRNFATGHLLAMVTLFALVFGFLSYQEAGIVWYLFWGPFIAVVILGQMFLFGGNAPRLASCVAGGCVTPVLCVVMMIVFEGHEFARYEWLESPFVLVGYMIPAAFLGVGLGYMTGAVCAGIFLLSERKWDAGKSLKPIVAERGSEGEAQGKVRKSDSGGERDPWSES